MELGLDTLNESQRSERMSRVLSRDTKPELRIRRLVHSLGYRYRLNVRDLPGKPDLVFRKRRKVLFVHGCFWHRHDDCHLARMPKSRLDFWTLKLQKNKARDAVVRKQLKTDGWSMLIIWECEISNIERVAVRIKRFLGEVL